MQCPRCGAILPNNSLHCSNCGIPLAEALSSAPSAVNEEASAKPIAQMSGWQENTPAATSPPFTPQLAAHQAPVPGVPQPTPSDVPYLETGWAEFSGSQMATGMPADARPPYPPLPPAAGAFVSSNNYPPMPAYLPPGFVPPLTSAPRRRGPPPAVTLILSVLVLLLVIGGIFVGIRIGQSHSGAAPAKVPHQLYQQVTSQSPSFVDSLQDATVSTWVVSEKPTYGCQIQSDGLHVHISDTDHFSYCTSGRGKFSNFAFQVQMNILSGNGGGVTFRGDTTAGNLYYFHIYPNGQYLISIEKNHEFVSPALGGGAISPASSSYGQTNTLTVIAQDNQLYFYVNQKFLTRLQDSTYSSGFLGVSASDSTASTEVVYSNAQIWNL